MPNQQEVEYFRNVLNKSTPFKMYYSAILSVTAQTVLAPFELVKLRSQLIQEGRKIHGTGTDRGAATFALSNEIYASGKGIRSFYLGIDSLIARGLVYGGLRSFFFGYFVNKFNRDPTSDINGGLSSLTGLMAGFAAGALVNPIDIVYNRQAAEALLPQNKRWNYSSLIDGLVKCSAEETLMRGVVATGLSYGVLLASMSSFYDFSKEYLYHIFGPRDWLRPAILIPTAYLGVLCYLPFDNIKVRLHTMQALPDGRLPYNGFVSALKAAIKYECNYKSYSSILALHSGAAGAFAKLYLTLLSGVYATDFLFQRKHEQGKYFVAPTVADRSHVDYIYTLHNPLSDRKTDLENVSRGKTTTTKVYGSEKSYLKV